MTTLHRSACPVLPWAPSAPHLRVLVHLPHVARGHARGEHVGDVRRAVEAAYRRRRDARRHLVGPQQRKLLQARPQVTRRDVPHTHHPEGQGGEGGIGQALT